MKFRSKGKHLTILSQKTVLDSNHSTKCCHINFLPVTVGGNLGKGSDTRIGEVNGDWVGVDQIGLR